MAVPPALNSNPSTHRAMALAGLNDVSIVTNLTAGLDLAAALGLLKHHYATAVAEGPRDAAFLSVIHRQLLVAVMVNW